MIGGLRALLRLAVGEAFAGAARLRLAGDLGGETSIGDGAEADGSSSRPSGLALQADAAPMVVAWRTATSTRWSSSARA